MMCPKCQTQNPDTAEYCENCETKLVKVCPSCSHKNPYSYIFCGECGHHLSQAKEPTVDATKQQPTLRMPTPKPTAEAPAQEKTPPSPAAEATTTAAPEPQPSRVVKWDVTGSYNRVSTGIHGLDQFIGGGFMANKVYLLTGESGTGKTIFGLQFILGGLIQGEGGIYVTGDEKPQHLIVDAKSLGWDLGGYIQSQKLGLLDVAPHFADLRSGKLKNVDVRTVIADLAKHAKSVGAKRIVIDPIAPLVFGRESSSFVQEYIRNLVFAMEDNLGCTILVVSDTVTGTSALSRYGVEELVTEGVIVLGISERDGKRVRTLTVRKMRATAIDIQDHLFEILPHKGIVLNSQEGQQ
jgi:circadian clock protein KaiC